MTQTTKERTTPNDIDDTAYTHRHETTQTTYIKLFVAGGFVVSLLLCMSYVCLMCRRYVCCSFRSMSLYMSLCIVSKNIITQNKKPLKEFLMGFVLRGVLGYGGFVGCLFFLVYKTTYSKTNEVK